MTMQATDEERRQNPGMVTATRDMGIRKGGGMDTARTVIDYRELKEIQAEGKGHGLTRFAIVMRMPDAQGKPGAGAEVAMPAEKAQKWYGQGYRFCVGTALPDGGYDTSLVPEETPEPTPMWLPSSVEDAMFKGDPIPEEMAPPGYAGETFSLKAQRVAASASQRDTELTASAVTADAINDAVNRALAEAKEQVPTADIDLDDYTLKGLKGLAAEFGIEPDDARSATKLRAQLATHLGRDESHDDIDQDE